MEYIIDVHDLKKSFKENEVLKGVNFKVKKGQIFTLLGNNGAGKTTIVKILSTLLNYDSGEITIDNINLSKKKEIRKIISLTGQYVAVDENLTGKENLYLVAKLLGVKGYRQKADEYLSLFDLTKAKDKLIKSAIIYGKITSLPNCTKKELSERHNLEKMFKGGEFNGR